MDCTEASNASCVNSSVAGCVAYMYDSGSDSCLDCFLLQGGVCVNASSNLCLNIVYDSTGPACINCSKV